jgi:hypothetical protein|tara:strand:- start:32 stop:433 length:402 start_codon:yes stop_codon:yes gene_type:complete
LAPFRFDVKEINKFQKMIRDSDYMDNNRITESERILRKNITIQFYKISDKILWEMKDGSFIKNNHTEIFDEFIQNVKNTYEINNQKELEVINNILNRLSQLYEKDKVNIDKKNNQIFTHLDLINALFQKWDLK